jgi:hypothetical protein
LSVPPATRAAAWKVSTASWLIALKARWTPCTAGRPRAWIQNQGLPSAPPKPAIVAVGSITTDSPSGASAIS